MSVQIACGLDALVPLFPLPEHVLLPAAPTPYRIFEPRYRKMVEDLLAKPADERFLVVPRVLAGAPDADGEEPFCPTAALGLMTLATPLTDGEWLIVVEGVAACAVHEVDAPFTPYRIARVTPLRDRPAAGADDAPSTAELIAGVFALFEVLGTAAGDLTPQRADEGGSDPLITYRIAAAVVEDVDTRQRVLEERCDAERRRLVYEVIVELLHIASRVAHRRCA
ncbi:MAG: hypothetical protein CVU56_05090 [Deltaproteobacteria bacterium HGW-Deltaproteobacteria-14]|jgi:hypothetical protein|nr:MAG: hypothetical protein CVU56_05090 [Deltaproteobacteria bacterium HGW-Deltaproteobacteria-14]